MIFNLKNFRAFLWSALILAVLWFFYMAVVPSGKIVYIHNFSDNNYFIQKLTPTERIELEKNGKLKIIGDPVYFALRTSRKFNSADLQIKYKNNSESPIIEAGVLMDKSIWHYQTQPLENKIIDELIAKWSVTEEGNTILLQKEKKYENINQFLNDLPERDEMALYNYDLEEKFLLPGYVPVPIERKLDYSLRGNYQIYTYIKNEDLDYTFVFEDINQNKDPDAIDINIYYANELIDSRHLDDDGAEAGKNRAGETRETKLGYSSLPEGIYKIEIKANNDIITKEIKTKQSRLAFINKIWLADGNKKITIYTDSSQIDAQTANPASLQTIQLGDHKLDIDETYKMFNLGLGASTSTEIKMQKNDIILSGNGMFSFEKSELINPEFDKIDYKTGAEGSNIKYILANYTQPVIENEWKVAKAKLDLNNAYREFYKYNILLAVPGLRADGTEKGNIEISEIKIELEGTSLWKKIKKIINIKSNN